MPLVKNEHFSFHFFNCLLFLLLAVVFSEEEKEQLRKFTNKSYLLDKRTCHQVYLSLVDILLAYCYEVRVTGGEKNVSTFFLMKLL